MAWGDEPKKKQPKKVREVVPAEGLEAAYFVANHGKCDPEQSVRTLRVTDDEGKWSVKSTFYRWTGGHEESTPPAANIPSEAFSIVTRTVEYTCLDQICMSGSWTDDPAGEYPCPETEEKTVQLVLNGVKLTQWSEPLANEAFVNGTYADVP